MGTTYLPRMSNDQFQLLASLLDAPGPSGFETTPARIWREAAAFADDVTVDVNGNSYATLAASDGGTGARRLMFAGHIDEIGVMVIHVDDDGYLWFDGIGGWDSQVFVGQRVTLLGHNGPVPGVIGKQAIHLMDQSARDKLSRMHDLWIDIGARNRAEALEKVGPGTPGVLGSSVMRLPNDRLVSRPLGDGVGA